MEKGVKKVSRKSFKLSDCRFGLHHFVPISIFQLSEKSKNIPKTAKKRSKLREITGKGGDTGVEWGSPKVKKQANVVYGRYLMILILKIYPSFKVEFFFLLVQFIVFFFS